MFKIIIVYFISIMYQIKSYTTQSPLWINNNFFRSSNGILINNNYNSARSITYSFVYSSVMTGKPQVAIGYKRHTSYSYKFTYQNFDLIASSISSSVLTVKFDMYNMYVYRIQISYFAIDPNFAYHINAFNNVHLNYTSGTLTTFNTKQIVRVTHTENINYTKQASELKFNKFSTPLAQNKMVLYLNSMYLTSGSSYQLRLMTSYSILNQSNYQIKLSLDYHANIYRYTFSIIIFNEQNVQSSKSFQTVSQYWAIYSGQYRQIKINFTDGFMLGLTDFDSYTSAYQCGIQYYWIFQTNARTGVQHQVYAYTYYVNYNSNEYALSQVRNHLFYIKTWSCNTSPYIFYNITTSLCQDKCPDYYIQNYTASFCDPCHYSCQDCSHSISQFSCLKCQKATNRNYTINQQCKCIYGYFDDGYNPFCRSCLDVDPYCSTCNYPLNTSKSTSYYQAIFSAITWKTDILSTFVCTECVNNYFINSTSKLCIKCTISNCSVCLNLTACSVCNSTALTIKYTDLKCYVCNITNCSLCSLNNVCVLCPTEYVLVSNQCIACNVNCICGGYKQPKVNGTCSTICGDGLKIENQQCDDSNNISHDGCSNLCKIETCSQNCSCDGWVNPWISINNSCSTICGDGIHQGIQECDDGNIRSHDGCSSICKNQPCQIGCICDGWGLPFIVQINQCTPICGDGFIRGEEECDDNNTQNNDGCNSFCKPQKVYLQQSSTKYISLVIFFFSLKIVGIQVLNVIQHFQLLIKTYKIKTFQISYFVHGYSNPQKFLFQISQNNQLLQKFNMMFIIIFSISILIILIEILTLLMKLQKNKVSCIKRFNKNKKIKFKDQSLQDEKMSQRINSLINYNQLKSHKQNKSFNVNLSNFTDDKPSPKFQFFKIFLRQILFDLIINCVSIVTFQIINQIKNNDINILFEARTIFIIIVMIFYVIGGLVFVSYRDIIFSQNQLKFHQKKAVDYWIIVVSQKVVFSILLNFKSIQSLYAMIGVKFVVIIIFICANTFVSIIQKLRNFVVNCIHLSLIGIFTMSQLFAKDKFSKLSQIKNVDGYFYGILIIILIVIMILFYIRQIINSCSGDQRQLYKQFKQRQKLQIQQNLNLILQECELNGDRTCVNLINNINYIAAQKCQHNQKQVNQTLNKTTRTIKKCQGNVKINKQLQFNVPYSQQEDLQSVLNQKNMQSKQIKLKKQNKTDKFLKQQKQKQNKNESQDQETNQMQKFFSGQQNNKNGKKQKNKLNQQDKIININDSGSQQNNKKSIKRLKTKINKSNQNYNSNKEPQQKQYDGERIYLDDIFKNQIQKIKRRDKLSNSLQNSFIRKSLKYNQVDENLSYQVL